MCVLVWTFWPTVSVCLQCGVLWLPGCSRGRGGRHWGGPRLVGELIRRRSLPWAAQRSLREETYILHVPLVSANISPGPAPSRPPETSCDAQGLIKLYNLSHFFTKVVKGLFGSHMDCILNLNSMKIHLCYVQTELWTLNPLKDVSPKWAIVHCFQGGTITCKFWRLFRDSSYEVSLLTLSQTV